MKIEAQIMKMYPSRRGTSKQGNPYCMTDVHVKFMYKEPGCQEQEHHIIATISGDYDEALMKNAVEQGKLITCTLYFGVREWAEDRAQTQARIYLPEAYMIKSF